MSGRLRAWGLTADRSKTFRERLWPWWSYAAIATGSLAFVPLTVAGWGFDHSTATRRVGLLVLLPGGLLMVVYALMARRHQRR